jgi:hypothetical protein
VVRAQSLRPTVLSWLARACTLRDATGRILQEVLGSGPRHGVFYKGGSHGEYTMLLLYCLTHPWNKAGPGAKPAHASPLWLLGRVFEARFILMVAQEPPPREVTVLRCGHVRLGLCRVKLDLRLFFMETVLYPWLVLASKVMEVGGKAEGIGFSHGRAILPHSTTTRPTGSGTQAGLVLWSAEEHAPHSIAAQDRRGCGLL